MAIYPFSAIPGVVDPGLDRGERPFAWFTYFLSEGGCVVIDERPALRLTVYDIADRLRSWRSTG
ncbi:hypothetical protein OHB06_06765 [Streptomyces sp. NBC_01604]|uniref:hypothetical protein n=1 Tax=Streptomyces sp. NBC_01604 TaxID=2975894 RepID=UPI00386E9E1C